VILHFANQQALNATHSQCNTMDSSRDQLGLDSLLRWRLHCPSLFHLRANGDKVGRLSNGDGLVQAEAGSVWSLFMLVWDICDEMQECVAPSGPWRPRCLPMHPLSSWN
jgi:hypothetical protein